MSLMFLQHVSFLVKPPYPCTHETWLTGHNFPSSLILTQLIMKVFFFLVCPPWKIDSNGLWAKATVTGSAQQLCCCSPVEFSSPPDGQSSSINKSVLKIEYFEQWRYSKYLHVSGEWTGKNLQGQVFRKQEEARGVVIWTFEYTQKISLVTFFSLLPKSQCQVSFERDYFGANLQQRPACLWKSFPHNFQQCPPMGGQWLIIKLLWSRLKSELEFYMHNGGGSKLTNVWVSLFFPCFSGIWKAVEEKEESRCSTNLKSFRREIAGRGLLAFSITKESWDINLWYSLHGSPLRLFSKIG